MNASLSARAQEIAGRLVSGLGRPALSRENRAVWDGFAQREPATVQRIFELARQFVGEPIPEASDAQYLEARQTKDWEGYSVRAEQRRRRLSVFVLAECLEDRGNLLPAIEAETAAICAERVWIVPAHDKNHCSFEGVRIDNDLVSAMTAWTLATADVMLDDRVDPALRQMVRSRIRLTVTGPFFATLRGLREPEWWFRDRYNWNVVIRACVTGAALYLPDDYSLEERAELIAAAEEMLPLYLASFPSDGYCLEGIGYWRYGFGHFALLAEAVLTATGGKLSFYESEQARLIAHLPERLELTRTTHFYPPIGDARFPEPPARWLEHILDVRYGLGTAAPAPTVPPPEGDFALGFFGSFLHAWGIVLGFDRSLAHPWSGEGRNRRSDGLRDWFEESSLLVTRQ